MKSLPNILICRFILHSNIFAKALLKFITSVLIIVFSLSTLFSHMKRKSMFYSQIYIHWVAFLCQGLWSSCYCSVFNDDRLTVYYALLFCFHSGRIRSRGTSGQNWACGPAGTSWKVWCWGVTWYPWACGMLLGYSWFYPNSLCNYLMYTLLCTWTFDFQSSCLV